MGKLFDEAISFAVQAHEGMTRKKSETPYILHPLEAAAIVGTMTSKEEVLAAAVLHDVVEDTPYTKEDIEIKFGKRVAELVASESENKREELPANATWKIRKAETLDHINRSEDTESKMIMLGDKLSNIRNIYRDQLIVGDEIWNKFNMKDKRQHEWYYNAIAVALKPDLGKFPAWQEYAELIKKVYNNDELN